MKHKHYSFDLWLTLIKSDPQFKQERDKYFHEKFNPQRATLEEVSKIIREVDIACNTANEITGGQITAYEMYAMVLGRLEYPTKNLGPFEMVSIYHYIETIFMKHPPKPYSEDTIPTLMKLKEQGATLSILSNTGFITHNTIQRVFQEHFPIHVPQMNFNHAFTFQLYSDEVMMSKPNKQFFDYMFRFCTMKRRTKVEQRSDILHVGDNPNADGSGAENAGMGSYIINSNQNTIKDLLTL